MFLECCQLDLNDIKRLYMKESQAMVKSYFLPGSFASIVISPVDIPLQIVNGDVTAIATKTNRSLSSVKSSLIIDITCVISVSEAGIITDVGGIAMKSSPAVAVIGDVTNSVLKMDTFIDQLILQV